MDSVISEAILTIAVVVASITAAVAFMETNSQFTMSQTANAEIERQTAMTAIKTVFAANDSSNEMNVWVKNVGQSTFASGDIERFNIFFGPTGNFSMIPFNATTAPSWTYVLVPAPYSSNFGPGSTIEITIQLGYQLTGGDYYFRVVTQNGVVDEYNFAL
jgi:hypothetical protein